MKLFIVLAVSIVATSANLLDYEKWSSFKTKYSKDYSVIEDKLRFKIFSNNLKRIEEHNALYEKEEVSFFLKATKFADWTEEEFKAMLKLQASSIPKNISNRKFVTSSGITRPESVDWREKNAVLPVKDQGWCGSCWAFSATGALEGQLILKYGQSSNLSAQELVDCNTENYGCSGGYLEIAFDYIRKNGISSEDQYPYRDDDGACKTVSNKAVQNILGYESVEQNEDTLADKTASEGPIAILVTSNWNWQMYGGGIMNKYDCPADEEDLNHAVLAVAYDAEKWVIKNSWGTDWGEEGYINLARGSNVCGLIFRASFPKV